MKNNLQKKYLFFFEKYDPYIFLGLMVSIEKIERSL